MKRQTDPYSKAMKRSKQTNKTNLFSIERVDISSKDEFAAQISSS